MSYFYFVVSGSNDIINVKEDIPNDLDSGYYHPEVFVATSSVEPGGGQLVWKKIISGSYYSWISGPKNKYSKVWDEAKRCLNDKDQNTRYRYDGSTIQPKSNVQSINYDSGSMDINDDGTLSWK